MITFVAAVLVGVLCGFSFSELDPTFFNYEATNYLNNFSWKTIHHFYQMVVRNTFQMFDYGEEKNFEIYGSKSPLLYPIGEIKVPTLIVSSERDNLVTIKDVERVFEELSPEAKVHGHWKLPFLNHLDYLTGLRRKELFVDTLLAFLNNLK
ncbi:hypothetical protein MTP99_012942 [Tenebrio molitor]|nr:hypothetical protein MTP99_012942 [Tenebrio molitor]